MKWKAQQNSGSGFSFYSVVYVKPNLILINKYSYLLVKKPVGTGIPLTNKYVADINWLYKVTQQCSLYTKHFPFCQFVTWGHTAYSINNICRTVDSQINFAFNSHMKTQFFIGFKCRYRMWIKTPRKRREVFFFKKAKLTR